MNFISILIKRKLPILQKNNKNSYKLENKYNKMKRKTQKLKGNLKVKVKIKHIMVIF